MYNTIYVPVDNSEYSNQAMRKAVLIGQSFKSKMVGSHVYAAKMHDYRFKQMEFTLPEEYLQEEEIERQRKIHDSLITMGLELISDCYLDQMGVECEKSGLPFERKMMDGKHHVEILKDITTSGYDLVVLGALGVGKTRDSIVGSVCERVSRFSQKDVLIIKHLPRDDEPERETILVGIDGSPQSFGALVTAIELAKQFDKNLELIGVYDPYLHYVVFNSIVEVLNEQASKVFRFEEQNQLHEEIIDTGLAQIYQSHLNVAESLAKERSVEVKKTLLDGKAFQKILAHVRAINPWLLVVGRTGVHTLEGETGLGSNTENLVRLCPCDILLSTTLEYPELDVKAQECILWTAEAEERMKRVPEAVRGIARTGILRLAIEQGHSVITNTVIDDAMDRFMPKGAAQATERLAKKLVLDQARKQNIAMCKKCGVTARNASPIKCSVCGNTEFDVLTPEMVEQLVTDDGGDLEEETTYDGRKLNWSREARTQLNRISDRYQKRRAKARIEKAARMKKLETITIEFAKAVIEDEIGKVLFDTEHADEGNERLALHAYETASDKKVIAVDGKGWELQSVFSWTNEAAKRLLQVPEGFMRERTQERVENLALDERSEEIGINLVEKALDIGRDMMVELLKAEGVITPQQAADVAQVEKGKCPFSALFSDQKLPGAETITQISAEKAVQAITNAKNGQNRSGTEEKNGEAAKKIGNGTVSHVYRGAVEMVLNEVGVVREMNNKRDHLLRRQRIRE